ncbi:hypothetical protein C8Q75DRAFT_803053 [Abortiporus biennis]|nr:hypothetical protein C8Q75DRAFT_803053 [Abortiporus biennis]
MAGLLGAFPVYADNAPMPGVPTLSPSPPSQPTLLGNGVIPGLGQETIPVLGYHFHEVNDDNEDEDVASTMSSTATHRSVLSARELRRLMQRAREISESQGLPSNALDSFLESGDMYEMLMCIQASLLSFNQALERARVASTLEDTGFQKNLQDQLNVCLFSTATSSYVTETLEHVMEFIRRDPKTFDVPIGLINNANHWSDLSTLVSTLLTSVRSNMKTKIMSSLESEETCSKLASRLMPSKGDVTIGHHKHATLLRQVFKLFQIQLEAQASQATAQAAAAAAHSVSPDSPTPESDTNQTEKTIYTSASFWTFLDDLLEEVHVYARAQVGTGPDADIKFQEEMNMYVSSSNAKFFC